tara:strand:+ start:14863 stop:18993 length:4131 start_codon:yes stop_codon:yes gene_type:complete
MATINLEGFGPVELRDDFLDLSPEDQQQEIIRATQSGPAEMPDTEEDSDVSVFRDVAEGFGAGLVGIAQGLSETAALGFDIATDSSTSRGVTESFEATKEALGFTPETTAGEVTNLITNFGLGAFIPLTWLSRAKAAAAGTQSLKASSTFAKSAEAFGTSAAGRALLTNMPGKVAATSLGVAASDFFVSPSSMTTIADAFDALPAELRTEDDTGLVGRDEALRRFRNKFRVATEGGALSGAFDIAIPVVGKAVGSVSALPGAGAVARRVSGAFDYLGNRAASWNWLNKNFTASGGIPREQFELLSDARGISDEAANDVYRLVQNFDDQARKVVKGQLPFARNKKGLEKAYSDLQRYLEGDKQALSQYGSKVEEAASLLRTQVDDLSDRVYAEVEELRKLGQVDDGTASAILSTIQTQKGSYLRRLYNGPEQVSDVGVFRSTAEYNKAVDEVTDFISSTTEAVGKADDQIRAEAQVYVDELLGLRVLETGFDADKVAAEAAKNLEAAKNITKTDVPLYDISEGILAKRSRVLEESPTVRKLLREKRGAADVPERVVKTVSDMANFVAHNKMYRSMVEDSTLTKTFDEAASLFNSTGAKPFIIRPSVLDDTGEAVPLGRVEEETLESLGYVKVPMKPGGLLDSSFGTLGGNFVRKELYDTLVYDRIKDTTFNKLLAVSLQAKGISQVGQTVLNPLGQIRNGLSNFFLLAANGNIARATDLADSLALTFGKPGKLSDAEFKEMYQWLGDLGLRDQNIVTNEYRSLIREGADLSGFAQKTQKAGQSLVEAVPFYRFLQKAYSGVDNAGKTAGLFAEQAKYANAFRRAGINPEDAGALGQTLVNSGLAVRTSALNENIPFLTVMAADIVKGTMPVYSRVPEAVKAIRRIPVMGNFIAFPAEIMRNTTNILRQSMREMGMTVTDDLVQSIKTARPGLSDQGARKAAQQFVDEVKAIGAKRVAGLYTSAFGLTAGVQGAMLRLNGMDDQDLEAMQRFSAPFQRGNALAPVNFDRETGKLEYVDLSYMMPYDFIVAPARRAMRTYAEKGAVDAGTADQILSSVFDASKSLLEPFAGESLVAERLMDIYGRQGRTQLGSPIFREGDDEGEKIAKSFIHVLGGFEPAMLKYIFEIRAGEIQPGRLVRAITDEPGRQGQEYTLQEELLTHMTGFRKMEMDLKKSLQYKGFEYGGKVNSIKSGFTSLARRPDSSAEEVMAEFMDVQEDLLRHQRALAKDIEAAQKLGLERRDIKRALKEGNVGSKDINAIMRGRRNPYYASQQLAKEIRRKARRDENRVMQSLDRSSLNRFARGLRRDSLFELEQGGSQPVENIEQKQPLSSPVAPATVPQPTARGPEASLQTPDLELLGSNPIDALKNLQILQRGNK